MDSFIIKDRNTHGGLIFCIIDDATIIIGGKESYGI